MNSETISQVVSFKPNETASFAEVVSRLQAAGVEYCHVDLVELNKTYYSVDGGTIVTPIPYEDLPPVGSTFDIEALKAAIFDSRNRGQKHHDFTRRAMAAGVQGYFVFLRVKQVTYWGQNGSQHTEWMPGAGPDKTDKLAA